MRQTEMQILLGIHLRELGIATVPEWRFDHEREWRIDLYSHKYRLGFEVSGGNWTGGHRRGHAQEDEYDKLNEAQMAGIRIMQFTNQQVSDGRAKAFISRYIEGKS